VRQELFKEINPEKAIQVLGNGVAGFVHHFIESEITQ
jgi:hypothetical protein